MKYLNHLNPRLQFYKVVLRGVSKDTKATNETNIRLQELANQANFDIAQMTNQANLQNTRETNSANIQMNEANNKLQMMLQKEMNEYNDISAQLERAERAGVNPNAVIQGTLSGNLQSTLPSTSAGHADSTQFQMPHPFQAPRVENPYMERISTLEQLRGSVNDFFNNVNTSATTEYTKQQAQAQSIENKYIDDLRSLGISLGKKQSEMLSKEIDVMGDQQQLMRKQNAEIDSKIKNMDEQTRALFIQNQTTEASNKGFIEYVRKDLDKRGIPRDRQLSDDSILAIKYGALTAYDLPLSQKALNYAQTKFANAQSGVQDAMRNLVNAQTKGQYIKNSFDLMFGTTERMTAIDNLDSQTAKNYADAKKRRQDYNIDNWKEAPEVQTQFVYGLQLNNMQTEANIGETNTRSAKNVAETIESGTRSASNLINTFTPWAK